MTNYDAFLSATGRQLQESAIRRMGAVAAKESELVSFAAGYPDAASFPWIELREVAAGLLAGTDWNTLQYGPTRGHAPLLEALVSILASRGITAGVDDLLVTTGSQQGLDLVARVLLDPGDVVLVELPTFTGAIAAFANARADLQGVRQDADGIDLDDLDRVWHRARAAGKRIKLLYLVPNFQNPTGRLLGLDKRRALLAWAARREVLILEDDPYGALYFEDMASEAETRPLRADDGDGVVIYISSFSKTLAPGFRVGWLVAPSSLVERFETAKQSVDLTSGVLDQRFVLEAIRRGTLERIAPHLREVYRRKRDAMEAALRRHAGDGLSWARPKGGFFLWSTLPPGVRDTELLNRAMAERLIFVVGSAFFVDGSGHDTIRLSFSAPSLEGIETGARRLGAALAACAANAHGR